jgi:hypothetical protein
MEKKQPKTVGKKEGVGAGILGIGLVLVMLPAISQQIADLEFVASSAFGIMTGAVYMFGLATLGAGAVVTFSNLNDDEEE